MVPRGFPPAGGSRPDQPDGGRLGWGAAVEHLLPAASRGVLHPVLLVHARDHRACRRTRLERVRPTALTEQIPGGEVQLDPRGAPGVWHFPFIIYYNLLAGAAVPLLIPILEGLVLGIVGWTIVNTCIYNSTQSVFLMILLHGWYNTVNSCMLLSFQNAVVQILSAILPWGLAIILLRVYGGENLDDRARPRAETAAQPASTSAR
jgi:hypothetical protein